MTLTLLMGFVYHMCVFFSLLGLQIFLTGCS